LSYKRLERGRFVWPQAASGTVSLTRAQLSMLLEGIDWRRPERTWDPNGGDPNSREPQLSV
jgi:transposase